jgi:PAS domain S-box-containing protein
MSEKLPYLAPRVHRHDFPADYPGWTTDVVQGLRQESDLQPFLQSDEKPQYITVVDTDRRYVQVSDSFCQLVGYSREELLGKSYDELTAPGTNDILGVFTLFSKLGYMQGLWMLVSHQGTRILVHYRAWIRPDSYIEGHMHLVGAGY